MLDRGAVKEPVLAHPDSRIIRRQMGYHRGHARSTLVREKEAMTILDRFRLDGKCALVTGGSRGLGKQMARALTEAGAEVAVVSRRAEDAEAAAAEIQTSAGLSCRAYACDVTVPEQVETLVSKVL